MYDIFYCSDDTSESNSEGSKLVTNKLFFLSIPEIDLFHFILKVICENKTISTYNLVHFILYSFEMKLWENLDIRLFGYDI